MLDPRPDYAREVRYGLVDARKLCGELGLMVDRAGFRIEARGMLVRCPWHDERTPSCSVRRAGDGTLSVRCYGCGAAGDALSLIAAVYKLDVRREFREVLRAGAELAGLHAVLAELSGASAQVSRPAPVAPPREPDATYPSERSLGDLLAETVETCDDPEVAAWLRSRGLGPELVDDRYLARALPATASVLPRWAAYRGSPWTRTGHRLIFPVYDAEGVMRAVRSGRVSEGDSPKRLPPGGHKAAGLVLADALAVAMLRETAEPRRVLFVEGEPDYLTHATRDYEIPTAVIGLLSGAWNADFAKRVPSSARVIVRTDHDKAGDKYAEEVSRSLRGRCVVLRSTEGG